MLTKEETLSFIAYLQKKDNVIIESQPHYSRTFFNRTVVDTYPAAERILGLIKNAQIPIEAYRAVAHDKARFNGGWRLHSEYAYSFREDLEEAGESEASDLVLETRDIFKKYFPTEYLLYLYETFDGSAQFVTSVEQGTTNNLTLVGNEFETKMVGSVSDQARLNIAYNSNISPIDEDKLRSVAEFLCEVLSRDRVILTDLGKNTVTTVRKMI